MKILKFTLILLMASSVPYAMDWEKPKSIKNGKTLFANNCAVCHGPEGIGPQSPALKGARKDGKYQPPALNGTAHTWHHSPKLLQDIIAKGGKTYGKGYIGWMPEFEKTLTKKERDDILIYIHSLWPNKIKQLYDKRFDIK